MSDQISTLKDEVLALQLNIDELYETLWEECRSWTELKTAYHEHDGEGVEIKVLYRKTTSKKEPASNDIWMPINKNEPQGRVSPDYYEDDYGF